MPLLWSLLDELPAQIGMTKIAPPYVFPATGDADPGVTGFVVIAESHISIHTFPQQGCLLLDVFSCRPFDGAGVVRFVADRLYLSRYDWRILDRSLAPHGRQA